MSFYEKKNSPEKNFFNFDASPDAIILAGYSLISIIWLIKFITDNRGGEFLQADVVIGLIYALIIIFTSIFAAFNKGRSALFFGVAVSIILIAIAASGSYSEYIDGVSYYRNIFFLEPVLPIRILNISEDSLGGVKASYVINSASPLIAFAAAFFARKMK